MNRRDILKTALSAIPGVPAISIINRIEPGPGQVFVIEVEHPIQHEQAEMIHRAWDQLFKTAGMKAPPCLILPGGMSLKVAKLP